MTGKKSIVIGLGTLWLTGVAMGELIVPIDADRFVFGTVFMMEADGGNPLFDGGYDAAVGFDPFNSLLHLKAEVPNWGTTSLDVEQHSEIGGDFIDVSGGAELNAWFGDGATSEVSGHTAFDLTFELSASEPMPYTLSGNIVAQSATMHASLSAEIRLVGPGGTIFEIGAVPDSSEAFSQEGLLEPGTYTLSVHATHFMDATASPLTILEWSWTEFDVSLQLVPAPGGVLVLATPVLLTPRRRRC